MSIFYPRKFNKALRNYLHTTFFTNATTKIEDPVFDGDGLDDLSNSGTYVPPTTQRNCQYTVTIQANGIDADLIKWKENYTDTWTTGVAITGGWQTLNNGVQIKHTNKTGHTPDDTWTFIAAYKTGIDCHVAQNEVEAFLRRLVPPRYVVLSGAQAHLKEDDCKTAYRPKIMAMGAVFDTERTAIGQNPITKYITVDDMTSNLKTYINMDNLRSNMKTYGFTQTITFGRWTEISEPILVYGEGTGKYMRQIMQLEFYIE
jgi:hypothetical protein